MFESLHIPDPLKGGAHVRVISPAMPYLLYAPERALRAEHSLKSLGYTVSYGPRARLSSDDGFTAGTGRDRAADFMEAFEDPAVDIVLAAEAGMGTRELLQFLDPLRISACPKPFLGYCDNIFLHTYLASEAGISSLYGATFMKHFGEAGGVYPETIDYFTRALNSETALECDPVPSRVGKPRNWHIPEADRIPRARTIEGGWSWVRPGNADGILVGGEITLIPVLVRNFGLSLESTVLFWDVAYHGLPERQIFKDLCESTDITRLAGMIVGAHPTIAPPDWAQTIADMMEEFVPKSGYPVVANSDISHLCPAWIVPFGERVVLNRSGVTFPRKTLPIVADGGVADGGSVASIRSMNAI